jgi:hypothetical protein
VEKQRNRTANRLLRKMKARRTTDTDLWMGLIVPYLDRDEGNPKEHGILGVSKHSKSEVQVSGISTGLRYSTLAKFNTWHQQRNTRSYDGHFINNAHYFLPTSTFYFRPYLFTVLLCSPLASQWPCPNVSENLLFHWGNHFCSEFG